MSLERWWAGVDRDSKLIIKVFGGLVLLGVVIAAIQCGA